MTKNEIKEEVLRLGSDSLYVFGGLFEGGINLQQVPNEITELLYYLINNKEKYNNFIEIGAAAGGNTKLFNNYFNFDNITIIDDNQHHKHHLRNQNLSDLKYYEFIGNSQSEEANLYVKNLNIKYDIMFIDADHSYEGVKKDTYNYIEFLKDDGILIFHDVEVVDGVKKWFNEIKDNNLLNLKFIMKICNNMFPMCGIGVFKKE